MTTITTDILTQKLNSFEERLAVLMRRIEATEKCHEGLLYFLRAELFTDITGPLWQCQKCGYVCREADVPKELTCKGRSHLPTAECDPDEYEDECPDCDSRGTFEEILK